MRFLANGALFLLFLVLFGCGGASWTDELLKETIAYDGAARKAGEELELDSGSSTAIWMQAFEEDKGWRKTVFRHFTPGVLYFERHIYFKDQEMVYAFFVGESVKMDRANTGRAAGDGFLLFSKQYFFRNGGQGALRIRQKRSDTFLSTDSILPVIGTIESETLKADADAYQKIRSYYDEVTSFNPL